MRRTTGTRRAPWVPTKRLTPSMNRPGRPQLPTTATNRPTCPRRRRSARSLPPRCTSATASKQPADPDGNPDTSFLVKIPADVAWTFQTLDKNGLVLNMAQTWHQLRPGEVRTNCGGCHAHSQKPTAFERTAAVRPDYAI